MTSLLDLAAELSIEPADLLAYIVRLGIELGDHQLVAANPGASGRTFTTPDGTYDDIDLTEFAVGRIREHFTSS